MPTFKAQIREAEIKSDGKCNIKIRVSHNGATRYISTEHDIAVDLFDNVSGTVSPKHPNYKVLSRKIRGILEGYEDITIDDLGDRVKFMDANQLVRALKNSEEIKEDFFKFADKERLILEGSGKKSTAELYKFTCDSIEKFIGFRTLDFHQIDYKFLAEFERFLKKPKELKSKEKKVLSDNTVSIHMRNVRHLLYLAKKQKIIKIVDNPFEEYKIPSGGNKKRNLTLDQIKAFRDYKTDNQRRIVARDITMLSFYLIGINVVDLFYCKHPVNGRVEYIRAKTRTKNGRSYSIKVEPEAQEIIDRYVGEKYLLRFSDHNSNERTELRPKYFRIPFQYRNHHEFMVFLNDNIKDIFEDLGFENYKAITTYWFRHSWATIAWNDCEIPEGLISVCLGHDETQNQTTSLYIEKRNKIIDNCNRKVIDVTLNV